MTTIPASYQDARRRFREYEPILRKRWPTVQPGKFALTNSEDLTIDWFQADAQRRKEKLLVITTGLHGIEGYIGSAVLQLFMEEFISRIDPEVSGVLFIHSLNPWGMSQWKRINSNNVDLNRNFISGDFTSRELENKDYLSLMPFLCPDRPLRNLTVEKWGFITALLKTVLSYGTTRLREAALMGEYAYPSGIYFGGQSLQEETIILMKIYRERFKGYQRIVHLDLHSGYGPRYQMTVVTSPRDKRTAMEIKNQYQLERVAGANPDEFYSMHGDMNDWEYELVGSEIPGAAIFAANLEFGTFGESFQGEARSLRITILKNQQNQFDGSEHTGKWVDREYRELYLPAEQAWLDKVQVDAREAFERILTSEGIIK